jgi:hypothetical protein
MGRPSGLVFLSGGHKRTAFVRLDRAAGDVLRASTAHIGHKFGPVRDPLSAWVTCYVQQRDAIFFDPFSLNITNILYSAGK